MKYFENYLEVSGYKWAPEQTKFKVYKDKWLSCNVSLVCGNDKVIIATKQVYREHVKKRNNHYRYAVIIKEQDCAIFLNGNDLSVQSAIKELLDIVENKVKTGETYRFIKVYYNNKVVRGKTKIKR